MSDNIHDSISNRGMAPEKWARREMRGIPASLGALWTSKAEDGSWRYALQLDDSHHNAQGFVHGGVLMSFLDHTLSLLAWEASGRAPCSTVQLDTHFLTALKAPVFIELDARILQRGKSVIFMTGTLRNGDTPVANATGVWRVARKSPSE